MKKLGIIMILAIVLTVGAVYGAFNYAKGTSDAATATFNNSSNNVTIAEKAETTKKGTITLTTTGVTLTVDNKGDYKTELKIVGNPKVKFTAATGADEDVRNNGIKLKLTITFTGNTYNSQSIFTTTVENNGVELNGGNKITSTDVELELSQYITLTEFTLDTADKYDAFKQALESTTITLTVSEA